MGMSAYASTYLGIRFSQELLIRTVGHRWECHSGHDCNPRTNYCPICGLEVLKINVRAGTPVFEEYAKERGEVDAITLWEKWIEGDGPKPRAFRCTSPWLSGDKESDYAFGLLLNNSRSFDDGDKVRTVATYLKSAQQLAEVIELEAKMLSIVGPLELFTVLHISY